MKNQAITFDLNINNNADSNLFLRKLWQLFRNQVMFKIFPAPSKDGKTNTVAIGTLQMKNHAIGITIKYRKRGCIQRIEFFMVPETIEAIIRNVVKTALEEYPKPLKEIGISYAFEAEGCYINSFSNNLLEITLGDDYVNNIGLTGTGYDLDDAFAFTKYQVDICLDLLSTNFLIPFDYRDNYSTRSLRIKQIQLVEDLSKADLYKSLQITDDFISLLDKAILIAKNDPDFYVFRAARLFRDALRLEKYGINNLSVSFKETAHTLYISGLEILSLADAKDNEQCKSCGQVQYKISKRVYDLILRATHSEKFAGIIKKDYKKRSKYLHTGKYFSANNYLGNHMPQLSIDDETGHILQMNFPGGLHTLQQLLRSLIIQHLQTAPSSVQKT